MHVVYTTAADGTRMRGTVAVGDVVRVADAASGAANLLGRVLAFDPGSASLTITTFRALYDILYPDGWWYDREALVMVSALPAVPPHAAAQLSGAAAAAAAAAHLSAEVQHEYEARAAAVPHPSFSMGDCVRLVAGYAAFGDAVRAELAACALACATDCRSCASCRHRRWARSAWARWRR